MAKHQTAITVGEVEIPITTYFEKRNSVRVSFGKEQVNIRIPISSTTTDVEKHYNKALSWIRKKVKENPTISLQYQIENYDSKKSIFVYGEELGLKITYQNRVTAKGDFDVQNKTILLVLPQEMAPKDKQKVIKKLLSRVCASIFTPSIFNRTMELNDQFFQEDIKSVRMKYNKSNWGSCSTSKNINLSTRLLFAPKDVIDYVIIHELAHLKEMNHSQKFWSHVKKAMPNYREKEQWLNENSALCDF